MFAATFLAHESDIWQVTALTRCGGHVGNSPPVVGCSACGLVLRGLKNVCMCSSELYCCQVSAVPICSSHRASWSRSAINQTAATAERPSRSLARSPVQKEIKATRDFIKRLQLLCRQAAKEHGKTVPITWAAGHIKPTKILNSRFRPVESIARPKNRQVRRLKASAYRIKFWEFRLIWPPDLCSHGFVTSWSCVSSSPIPHWKNLGGRLFLL